MSTVTLGVCCGGRLISRFGVETVGEGSDLMGRMTCALEVVFEWKRKRSRFCVENDSFVVEENRIWRADFEIVRIEVVR